MKMITVEAKLFLRDPATVAFGVFFPTGLLLGLGSIPTLREITPETGGLRAIDIWAPTALVFGMVMIAVQHVPAVIATSRERAVSGFADWVRSHVRPSDEQGMLANAIEELITADPEITRVDQIADHAHLTRDFHRVLGLSTIDYRRSVAAYAAP